MPKIMQIILLWLSQILGILFALFLGLFAVEVFYENYSFFKIALEFCIQLIPALLVITFTVISGRQPIKGASLFAIMGTAYVLLFLSQPWQTHIFLAGPQYFIALLLVIRHFVDKKVK